MALAMGLWVALEALGGWIGGGYSPYQVVWTRYAVHIALLATVLGHRGRRMVRTRRPVLQVFRGLLMVAMPAFYITGARSSASADVWAEFWVAPLMVVGLSVPLLGEAPGMRLWLATGAGLVGALLIARPFSPLLDARAIFPLGMAACFALYLVLTRRLGEESVETRLFYTALVPFLCLSPVMVSVGRLPTPRAFLLMALVGVVGLLVLWALDKALDLAPASLGAPFIYTQLLWAMVLGEEGWGGGAIAGALIVIASVAYVFRFVRRLETSG
jgi:drug/metabolite transporter (DMT)-like permease